MPEKLPIRLAFRAEGDFWNAYAANLHSMKDALLLGSIRVALVANDESRKSAFMELMQGAMNDVLEDILGQRPEPGIPTAAPEHERSGRA